MICIQCSASYRKTVFNNTDSCVECLKDNQWDTEMFQYEEDYKIDVDHLVNPSGKVQPVFYD